MRWRAECFMSKAHSLNTDLRCLSCSPLVHLCPSPSHLCYISVFCSLTSLFCPPFFTVCTLSHKQVTKIQLVTRVEKKCKCNWPFNEFCWWGLLKHHMCFLFNVVPHGWPPCRSKSVEWRPSSLALGGSFNNTFLLHLNIAAAQEVNCHYCVCAGCFSPMKGSVYLSIFISPHPLSSRTIVTMTTFTSVTCEYWI